MRELGFFDVTLRPRLIFGAGAHQRLGALVRELGAERAFLVTDRGIRAAGHVARVEASLTLAGVNVLCFDGVRENPTGTDVKDCLESLGSFDAQVLIGLGGGSAIDTAKGCAFLRAGGGVMDDYWGKGKAKGSLLPLIAVPTTAGTGTETQSFALIEQDGTHRKMACGDPLAAPRIALLDPTLTLTLPRRVTAVTGLDAVGHAIESAVSTARTAFSVPFAHEAFRLLDRAFPRVLADPEDVVARGQMMLGAAYAGIAIEASMLGAAHAMANPLTAQFGVVHGQAVAMALPCVIRHNAQDPTVAAGYTALLGVTGETAALADAGERLAARVLELMALANVPAGFSKSGVTKDAIPALARDAATQWTGTFNPVPVTEATFAALYTAGI